MRSTDRGSRASGTPEGEELAHDPTRILSGIFDRLELIGVVQPFAQEPGVAPDDQEQVVEVVCDPAGEPADRFHLRAMGEPSLELLALRGVRHEHEAAGIPVARSQEGGEDRSVEARMVPSDARQLMVRARRGAQHVVGEQMAVLSVRKQRQPAAEKLFPVPAEGFLGRSVPPEHPGVVIELEDGERGGLDQRLETFHRVLELPLEDRYHSRGDDQGGGGEEPAHRGWRRSLTQRFGDRITDEDEGKLDSDHAGREEVGGVERNPEVEELVRTGAPEEEPSAHEYCSGHAKELVGGRAQAVESRTRHEREQDCENRGPGDGERVARPFAREGG